MIGETLGRYRIVDTIGSGGMGVVYRAYDPTLDREVALKLLNGEVLTARRRAIGFSARRGPCPS